MDEQAATLWVRTTFGTVAVDRLSIFAGLVRAEAANQNLVAPSTLDRLWSRHLVDSAQLLLLAPDCAGAWLDIGTGAGFPGLVVAILRDGPISLVEPRRRRAEFLRQCVAALDLGAVDVVHDRIERVTGTFGIISARAVAALPELFGAAEHCCDAKSIWLLPKGRSAAEEVASARRTWHGTFHVEQSITEPTSRIVVARGVRRR